MPFWPIFGNFLCPVVTSETFCSNLAKKKNIQKNPKNFNKIKKNQKLKKVNIIQKMQKKKKKKKT